MVKIAVVVPSGDRVHANFTFALAFMVAACRSSTHQMTREAGLVFINPKGSNVAKQRWQAVSAARGAGCEWILMLDSDITFPHTTLSSLLQHNKDIVGASYGRRVPPHNNLIVPLRDIDIVKGERLVEVLAIPAGCMLIRASVFDKITPPYFQWGVLREGETLAGIYKGPDLPGEDYMFCLRAREAGFQIFADLFLSTQLVHWGEQGTRLVDASQPLDFELVELD